MRSPPRDCREAAAPTLSSTPSRRCLPVSDPITVVGITVVKITVVGDYVTSIPERSPSYYCFDNEPVEPIEEVPEVVEPVTTVSAATQTQAPDEVL